MHGLTRIFLTLLVASQALAHGDQKEATPNDEHNARYYRTMLEQWEGIKAKPIRAFKKELVSLLESAAEHLLRTEQHPNQRAGCLRLAVIVDTLSVEDEADFFLKLHIFAKNETVRSEE